MAIYLEQRSVAHVADVVGVLADGTDEEKWINDWLVETSTPGMRVPHIIKTTPWEEGAERNRYGSYVYIVLRDSISDPGRVSKT